MLYSQSKSNQSREKMSLPKPLIELRRVITRLPGFSERGSERFLDWWWQHMDEARQLGASWSEFLKLKPCQKCFFFALDNKCAFCDNPERDYKKICILTSPFTVDIFEKDTDYDGLYFILQGEVVGTRNIKSIENVKNRIAFLKKRIALEKITEVIVATDFTSKGEATSLYIEDSFKELPVKVTRLARGFHPGDSLGYSDPITLKSAFNNRKQNS